MCRSREEKTWYQAKKLEKLPKKGKVQRRQNQSEEKVTDAEIDNLQRYYGLAIRRNLTDVQSMENAAWATYLDKMFSDDNPQHHFCPEGADSWCKYNNLKDTNTPYKQFLPMDVMLEIETVQT